MSLEGQHQYRRARDDRMEKKDCKRCEDSRDYLLAYSEDTFIAVTWQNDEAHVLGIQVQSYAS